jgi:hypothetical protein
MNRKISFSMIIAVIITTQTLFAQSVIRGKITDANDKSSIAYAGVMLFKPDSSLVSGVTSDLEGMFELKNIPTGSYMLSTSFLGYETAYLPLYAQENNAFVHIFLRPSAVALGEVTVEASSVMQKADRMVVLPTETLVKTSTGGIDLLQKLQLPRIYIDPVSEDISTNGNSEVQLRLNGVEVTRSEIAALRPADILRIEYHEDPGARYGKAAAVLNYITKEKAASGGNIKGTAGAHLDGKQSDDRLSFQYNKGKSEFSANADYMYRRMNQVRNYDERFLGPDHQWHLEETGEPVTYIKHLLNTTINYSLTEKEKYFFNVRFRYSLNNLPYAATDRKSTLTMENDTSFVYDHAGEKNQIPALDLYFQRNLKNNQLLIVNVVATYIQSDYARSYAQTKAADTLSAFNSSVSGNKYSLIAEGIYEKRGNADIFTAGSKHTQTYAKNLYGGTTEANISMNQAESYIYAEYQRMYGKWSYMANLAAELFYFSQKENTTTKLALLPSARITWAPNGDWNFRYRVNLQNTIPSLAYLNDVEQQIDPLQIRRGNPDLKSFQTLMQSVNVGFNKKIVNMDLLLGYKKEFNPVMESVFYEEGRWIRMYENQHNFQTFTIEPTLQLKPWKNYLTLSLAPRFVHFVSNGNNYAHTCDVTTLRIDVNGYYKNWFAAVMAYKPPHLNYFYGEQSYTSSIMYVLSLGYTQKNWSLSTGMMYPTGDKYKMQNENLAALNPFTAKSWNQENQCKINIKCTWKLDFGKQAKEENRRMENKDENAGIMQGVKN